MRTTAQRSGLALSLALVLLNVPWRGQAHEHLAAGAASTAPGSPLIFVNAADYSSESGYVFGLESGDSDGPYVGYYYTGDAVFVALAATPDYGGPEPLHAALGAHVEVVLESLTGPPGGQFGFWETAVDDVDSTNLTWSVPVGLTGGTNRIAVSESEPDPGADPYGHKHGRLFSATLPGLYQAGFRFIDTSTNGPAGGPIQAPSERFHLYFQAGISLADMTRTTNGLTLAFAAPSNLPDTGDAPPTSYTLESSPRLGVGAEWKPFGDAIAGDDHLHRIAIPAEADGQFLRLRTD